MEKQNKNCQDPILCSISPEPSAYGTKKTTKKNDRTQFSVSSPTPLGFAFFFVVAGAFSFWCNWMGRRDAVQVKPV